MKYNILFVLSIVTLFLSSCGKKENDLTAFCIKGDAAFVTDTIWNVSEKFGEVVKDDINYVGKANFDDNGNITDYTVYDSCGKVIRKIIQKWNDTTLDEIYDYDGDGKQQIHKKYYIENDKVQKMITTCTMSEKWVSTTTYYYSNSNPERLDSIIEIEDSKKDIHTFKYFDDNNSYHEYIKYHTGNKSDGVYYLDKNKRLIKEKQSNGTTTYAYNDEGLLVKKAYDDGIIDEYVYEFDKKGSLIKRITYVTNESKNATEMLTRHIEYK